MDTINLKKVNADKIVFGDCNEYKIGDYDANYLSLKNRLNSNNFFNLSQIISNIDSQILPLIRELTNKKVNSESIYLLYKHALDNISVKNKIDLFLLLDILNNNDVMIENLEIPDINISVNSGISNIRFSSKDKEFLVENPNLLWECNKVIFGKCDYKKCKIHSHFNNQQEADDFSNMFKKGVIKLKYDDTITFWKQYPDLWPASIDTFNLIADLRWKNYHKRFFNTVLDLGTGTGMLGLWLANNNNSIKKLILSDWLLLPLVVSCINAKFVNTNCNINYTIGLNTTLMGTDEHFSKVDLAVCNPPYIPALGFENLMKESTVAGTNLLEHVIRNHKSIANETVISFSDLALPEAMAAATDVCDLMKMKLPNSHEVPFRVKVAFQEDGYIEKLIKEKRNLIIKENNDAFPYWHRISTYILKN